jgi:hypothetical protein
MVSDSGGGGETDSGGGVVGYVKDKMFGKSESKSSSTSKGDKALMSTLSNIDRTLKSLPGEIASIEITAKPAGNI